jgi:hypothetical protein
MHYMTKLKLAAVHQWCDVEDKSTEFMIQFMQDACKVDHDCVMNYLSLPAKEHSKLFKELNDFLNWFTVFEES